MEAVGILAVIYLNIFANRCSVDVIPNNLCNPNIN